MTCRTCDCADKAADTDEWVTFAKRPVEPLTSWSHHDIPELAAEKVSEVTFSWQHQSQQPQIARLTAERDALAAQVARVEKLAEEWRYKGEFGWGAWQLGEGPDPEGYVMDHCADALRAALAGSEADTGAEEAGHRCEPYYSRAECGQCGWQEQWCVTCSRQMCGCATDTTDQEDKW